MEAVVHRKLKIEREHADGSIQVVDEMVGVEWVDGDGWMYFYPARGVFAGARVGARIQTPYTFDDVITRGEL